MQGRGRLSEGDVLAIRQARADGATISGLAKKYKLDRGQVSRVCIGSTYAHVGGPRTKGKYVPPAPGHPRAGPMEPHERAQKQGRKCSGCGAAAVDKFRGEWLCRECMCPAPDQGYLEEERSRVLSIRTSAPCAERDGLDPPGDVGLQRLLDQRVRENKIPRLPGHQLRGVRARNRSDNG